MKREKTLPTSRVTLFNKFCLFALKHCFGCSYWHSAALLNLSTLTLLVLSYGCLCPLRPPTSSSSPSVLQLSLGHSGCSPSATGGAVWTVQFGHLASVSGRNVAVALAPVADTTQLGWGVAAGVDVTPPHHPLWLERGGHGHRGTQRASGCASLEVTVLDQNHTEPLLIKWLSVHPMVSQRYMLTKPVLLHKKSQVKRHQAAIETATLLLCLSMLLPATVNKYGTWYQRCSVPSPFPSPLLVERSPLHTKQSNADSLISNYAL